jgi:hypothetical protein
MIKNFEDMQKLGQTNVDSAMKFFGEWNKNWVEQAVEIQTGFAKRAYDDYMQQMSKIGGMYASMAKEAYKPVEKLLQNGA